MLSFAALPILAVVLAMAPTVLAQANGGSNVTCDAAFWEYNDIGQSPCFVLGEILSLCSDNTGGFVYPLTGPTDDNWYLGPSSQRGSDNECFCNVVSYNLMAACTDCQEYTRWWTEAQWNSNCTSYESTGLGNLDVSGIHIPPWAYLPDNGAGWNANTAQVYYDQYITSTASSSTTASATSTSSTSSSIPATTTPATTSSAPTASGTGGGGGGSSSSSSGSNTGAIAGGVVGGVVVLIAIAGLIFWLMRRNRRAAIPATFASAETGAAGTVGQHQYGNEQKPMSMYSASPELPYSVSPTLVPGTTPSPYPYQPGTPGMGYDGAAPASSYPTSPIMGPHHAQQASMGRYTGLPEADVGRGM